MTIQEAAKQLRDDYYKDNNNEKIKALEEKINKLEKIIINLNIRLMALEEN